MGTSRNLLSVVLLLTGTSMCAQEAALDPSFSPGTGPTGTIAAQVLQSDGKFLIGGGFGSVNGTTRGCVARLNSDGSVDMGFNSVPGAGGDFVVVNTISLQPDGKIIIGGSFISYNGIARNCIARLNADGSLDTSFDPGTGANDQVLRTVIQSDGKILVAGRFTTFNGIPMNRLVRLNTDGSLDASFSIGQGADATVNRVVLQPDGRILIAGTFTAYHSITRHGIARVLTNGDLDASFDPGAGTNSNTAVHTLSLQSDGRVVIGGSFTSYASAPRNHIARVNTDGSLDNSFDPGTGTTLGFVYASNLLGAGKVLIAGCFTQYNGTTPNGIARLN
ncbi:MAG TPA: delta-60 repeat domain-containing protein, partial [Flavobacteriales bacterium]|nr:delta-60 repeat domain-containing protein [Flavobacteriales bacterium]